MVVTFKGDEVLSEGLCCAFKDTVVIKGWRLDCISHQRCWDGEDVTALWRVDRRSTLVLTHKNLKMEEDIAVVGIGCNFPGGMNNI